MAGWSPWRALREREHLVLEWRDLPRSVCGAWIPHAAGATIVLATWLSQRARRCTLSHELVHDERGLATTAMPPALAEKEEEIVARTSALRLVPLDELADFVRVTVDTDGWVTASSVAEAFDVTEEVARVALLRLPCAS